MERAAAVMRGPVVVSTVEDPPRWAFACQLNHWRLVPSFASGPGTWITLRG